MAQVDMDALVTASQGAAWCGRTVAAVCNWRDRGLLQQATGRDGRPRTNARGHKLYRLGAVLEAEAADRRTTTGRRKVAA